MSRGAAGFSLVEMLVALVILILALALAAQLLGETAQMMADAGRQALDPAPALAAIRLRVDVQGATAAVVSQNLDGSCADVELLGYAGGPIYYQIAGGALTRLAVSALGKPETLVLLPGASGFLCQLVNLPGMPQVLRVDYQYVRSTVRRSALDLELPALWGPRQMQVVETYYLAPRGGGFGGSW